jgi:hypothetical protein
MENNFFGSIIYRLGLAFRLYNESCGWNFIWLFYSEKCSTIYSN